jgi:hypothetical protein
MTPFLFTDDPGAPGAGFHVLGEAQPDILQIGENDLPHGCFPFTKIGVTYFLRV